MEYIQVLQSCETKYHLPGKDEGHADSYDVRNNFTSCRIALGGALTLLTTLSLYRHHSLLQGLVECKQRYHTV